jgi:hypothetical protein
MKKQTNLPASGRKLSLNKKTISNLQPTEMNKMIGGSMTYCTHSCHGQGCGGGGGATKNGNTCYGHYTCYSCI